MMMRTHKPYKFTVFGSRLRSMILQQDADIRTFIRRSGMNDSVYQYVLGAIYPPPHAMMKICEALGCTVEDIMDPVMSDEEFYSGSISQAKKNRRGGKPGVTGNPKGIKFSQEEKDVRVSLRNLLPDTAEKLEALLDSPDTKPMAKVRTCVLIMDKAFGKPKPAKRMNAGLDTVEQSQHYIQDLASRAAGDGKESDLE